MRSGGIQMNYRQRLWGLGGLDAIIVSVAVLLAYFLRFDFRVPPTYLVGLPYVMVTYVLLIWGVFKWTKVDRRIWRYASVGEGVVIAKAVTVAALIFFAGHQLVMNEFLPSFVIPKSIYLLSWLMIILGTGSVRFTARLMWDSYSKIKPHQRRTLIIGAGAAGALVAKELKHSPHSDIYPVAFIDDAPSKQNLVIVGLPVRGKRDNIAAVVEEWNITQIIIALPSASRTDVATIYDICKKTGVQSIKIFPQVADLINGKSSLQMIREVQIEDLLGREPIQVDLEGVANYVTGQTVLVTGAGGSIGSELCRQISPFEPDKLLLLGHGENSIYDIELEMRGLFPDLQIETIIADIQDRKRIRAVFEKHRPSVVFHAAAHKHVPLMERNPSEAVKNNILGTKNVAECAHEFKAKKFVMISTDKAVNPTNVMGASKRCAEMIIQGIDRISETSFVVVRFGNVLGSRGSVIPIFKRQIQAGGPVTVTHPQMVRYFMTIPEAVQLVIQAGALAAGGEIFILDMGQPVKIVDLARELIRLSGFEPDVDMKIAFTGIRPGEKLYEELLTSEEGISATKHNRIFVGQATENSWDHLQFVVRKLEQVAMREDEGTRAKDIRDLLLQVVPTYKYTPPTEAMGDGLEQMQRAEIEAASGNE